MTRTENLASITAFKDISAYIKEEKLLHKPNNEIWVVTPTKLNSKRSRRLNRELGIHKINKQKN